MTTSVAPLQLRACPQPTRRTCSQDAAVPAPLAALKKIAAFKMEDMRQIDLTGYWNCHNQPPNASTCTAPSSDRFVAPNRPERDSNSTQQHKRPISTHWHGQRQYGRNIIAAEAGTDRHHPCCIFLDGSVAGAGRKVAAIYRRRNTTAGMTTTRR